MDDLNSLRSNFNKDFACFVEACYGGNTRLANACKYALEGPGKRIRPLLVLLVAKALGKIENALLPAIAVEMIHTYSLVHDDLPGIDNDSLRRGRPTVHTAFDEATAILVGDAILSDVWSLLAKPLQIPIFSKVCISPETSLAMIDILATACGSAGMVGGQMLDVFWTERKDTLTIDLINQIQTAKTARLFGAAARLGAVSACADIRIQEAAENFGLFLGRAFQVVDDLIDSNEATGKSQGKDKIQGKPSYLAVISLQQAKEMASNLHKEAIYFLDQFAKDFHLLKKLTDNLLHRSS